MKETGESSYRRFLQPDRQTLEALIRTYSDPLVRFAFGYVKNAAVAEDIMEDSFAALFLKPRKFHNDDHIRAWLYKVTRNKCMDYLRRHRREVPLEDVENVLSSGDAEGDLFRQERNRKLYLCMQELPEQYRQVLELSYFDRFSTDDICRIMGKSPKQVYNLHARAKTALKDRLQKEGITYEDL